MENGEVSTYAEAFPPLGGGVATKPTTGPVGLPHSSQTGGKAGGTGSSWGPPGGAALKSIPASSVTQVRTGSVNNNNNNNNNNYYY